MTRGINIYKFTDGVRSVNGQGQKACLRFYLVYVRNGTIFYVIPHTFNDTPVSSPSVIHVQLYVFY